MVQETCFGFLKITLVFLLLCPAIGLLLKDQNRGEEDDQELNKAILEMLHINKVSASHQAEPHPYMKQIYKNSDFLEAQDFGNSDGTLMQSYRSVVGEDMTSFLMCVILPLCK